MREEQMNELILQSLEHERGGVRVYEKALECAIHEELREEWEKYLEQTRNHVLVLTRTCEAIGLDPEESTPGCEIVKSLGEALVAAMDQALEAGNKQSAQLVACECVVLAETKDHLDWELIGKCAEKLRGAPAKALKEAYEECEDQEDEHLYHTQGWCRELWIESLGMKATLPPPEERKHVKTAIGAARAQQEASRSRSS